MFISILLALLGGCTGDRYEVHYIDQSEREEPAARREACRERCGVSARPRVVDLVLGPTDEHAQVAELFVRDPRWRSAYLGEIIDESVTSVQINTDDQSYSDRLGGWYSRYSDSIRVRTTVR